MSACCDIAFFWMSEVQWKKRRVWEFGTSRKGRSTRSSMRLSPRCPPTPSSFGSYARSEATEESDIDILTLTSLVKPDLIRARTKAGLKMWVIDLDRDFVVLNTERSYDVLASGEPFARNVVEDGILIYGEFREIRKLPQGDVEIDMQDDAAGAEEDEVLFRMAQARLVSADVSDAILADRVYESLGIKLDDGE